MLMNPKKLAGEMTLLVGGYQPSAALLAATMRIEDEVQNTIAHLLRQIIPSSVQVAVVPPARSQCVCDAWVMRVAIACEVIPPSEVTTRLATETAIIDAVRHAFEQRFTFTHIILLVFSHSNGARMIPATPR